MSVVACEVEVVYDSRDGLLGVIGDEPVFCGFGCHGLSPLLNACSLIASSSYSTYRSTSSHVWGSGSFILSGSTVNFPLARWLWTAGPCIIHARSSVMLRNVLPMVNSGSRSFENWSCWTLIESRSFRVFSYTPLVGVRLRRGPRLVCRRG